MRAAEQRWDRELDRLDATLADAEAALAAGAEPSEIAQLLAAEPPEGVPALPASRRDRAEATLGHIEELCRRLGDQLAALGTTIARSQRPAASAPEPATARFIDQAV